METRDGDQEHHSLKANANDSLVDASLNSRLGFIRKVYGILCFQLTFTALISVFALSSEGLSKFLLENVLLLIIAFIVILWIEIAVLCCRAGRTSPNGYIYLGIFTFCFAYIIAAVCCSYVDQLSNGLELIIMAFVMTVVMTLSLTFYACTTKSDFTGCGLVLFCLSICLLLFGIFLIFTSNPALHIFYCVVSIFLYSLYLIFDTQLIMGNKSHALSEDDYIIGAMILYIDIVIMFLKLLELLAAILGKK